MVSLYLSANDWATDFQVPFKSTWPCVQVVSQKKHTHPMPLSLTITASCSGVAPESLDWFKIESSTWDGSEWPTAAITRDEPRSFSIPSDIAPG
jgi:hypothetical protein